MDKHEIAKQIATEIFYLPATNGKAEASIKHGTELILKAMQEVADPLDKELDLVHTTLTELYNIDAAAPIIKKCLDKIEKLQAT